MKTLNTDNPNTQLSPERASDIRRLNRFQKVILTLRNKLEGHIESSKCLEYLDEIKDLLLFLNDLESSYFVVRQECIRENSKQQGPNLKPQLDRISKETLVLQMAIDSVVETNKA